MAQYLLGHSKEISDPKGKKRVIDALIRKGHSYQSVRRALEQMAVDTEDLPED